MINFFRGILLCAILTFSQLVFAADYKLVVYETANPTSQTTFAFTPESPGNSNYIATVEMSGNILDYSCCLMVNNVMSSNVYDLSTYLSSCTTGVFSVKTDINNTSGQLYNFNCIDISSSTVYGMACWDAPIVGEGKCIVGSAAAAANNIFSVSSPNVFTYDFVVDTPTAGFKILFSNSSTSWDWANELGKGGSILNIGYGMRPQGGSGDLYLNLSGLQSGEKVRLTLEKTGLNYTLSASFVDDPKLSYRGDDCSTIKFLVDNYDSSLAYDAKLDGSSVTIAPDGTYTVSSPIRGHEYTFSVSVSKNGLKSNEVEEKYTLPLEVAVPHITASSGCDVPVKFTITNYDASLDYTWEVNGISYSSNVETFVVSAPEDRIVYTAQVKATDNCTSATSNSVSQTYIQSPAEPQISISHDCGFPIVFKLDNNSAYSASYSQVWKVNGVTVTPINGEYSLSSYSDGVTYTLELEISNSKDGVTCKKSATAQVVAKVSPTAPRVSSYDECADPSAADGKWADLVIKSDPSNTLRWYSSNDMLESPIVAPVNYDKRTPGKQSYWVTQVTPAGCESASRTEVKVNVYEVPVAEVGADLTVCYGESAVLAEGLSDDANINYTWSPAAKLQTNNTQSVTTKPLYSDSQFTLKVSNKGNPNCYSEDNVKVTVLKKPEISFNQSKFTICEDGSVQIINTKADPSNESYDWEAITNGVSTYVGGSENLTLPSVTENTTIRLTSSLNVLSTCTSSSDANITVIKRPVADAGPDLQVCYGEPAQIGSSNVLGVRYQWDNASDLNNPNISNPTINSVTTDKVYKLTASSTAVANCSSTDEVAVYKIDKPTKYTLSGGGSYCETSSSSGINLTLSGSSIDTEYELVRNGVGDGNYRLGVNGPLEWQNVQEGTYKVRARKAGYNTCEEEMTGIVTVNKVPSPDAKIELVNSQVACPGDPVDVRVSIIGGLSPYKFTLLENGTPTEIVIPTGNTYQFTYTPQQATVFQISQVSDAVCSRVYDPMVGLPTLDMTMANLSEFEMHSSNGDKPVCFGDNVTIGIDYNDPAAEYYWESGQGGNSITISASADAVYKLLVVTPQGCQVSREYTLDVVEKVPITISGFDKVTANGEYFLCSSDDPVVPIVTPSNGQFISDPQGLIKNGTKFDPSAITQTTRFEVKYEYTDVNSGCVQEEKFNFLVSAINKEVNWTLAPTNDLPNAWAGEFQKCQPDPAEPKDVIKMQGHPQVAAGEWHIEKAVDENGTPVTNQAQIIELDEELAIAQIKNLTAGETYFISYTVKDEFGCEGNSTKTLKINSKPTNYIASGGLSVSPSEVLCVNKEEATIWAAQNPGSFKFSAADAAMFVGYVNSAGEIQTGATEGNGVKFNPSKGKAGQHNVVYTVQHQGCSYSEEVTFSTVNPILIEKFDLPKKEFCATEAPVLITVKSTVPTKGSIMITNQAGVVKLATTDITNSPMFDPAWGEGTYTITYNYNDGTCDAIYKEEVVVHPTPVIVFDMKDDYCYGEDVIITDVNYGGGNITIDPLLPPETLVGNKFKTEVSGLGVFTIGYEVHNEFGCVADANKTFQVRGVQNMSVMVNSYFCEPKGTYEVKGFPKPINPADKVYFTTDQHIDLVDNGNGTGTIGLDRTTLNTTYPLTFHYVESYLDKNGTPQECESSVTKDFKVLDEAADFYGIDDQETICSDVLRIELQASIKANSTFEFSASNRFPDAFKDNGDGTAILLPSELPEDYYYITMTHRYYDGAGVLVCESVKTKSFRISKIEAVTDIELFCAPVVNKTAVKIKNAEQGIRYDLYVNNAVYDSYEAQHLNQEIQFKAIDAPSLVTAYIMAVEPNADACSIKLSKEFSFSPLVASVESENISCFASADGKFIGTAQGGITYPTRDYSHRLLDENGNEIIPAASSISLDKGIYKYEVTDAIGCVEIVPFEITEPNALDAKLEQTDVDCYGETTAILKATVLSNAGTPDYKYEWTKIDPVLGNQVISDQPTINVGAGQYHVRIEDANKCIIDKQATVIAPLEELKVELDYKVDVQIRGNATGEIYINVSGGTPDALGNYTYEWSGVGVSADPAAPNYKGNKDLTNLVTGTYYLKVTDDKGCVAVLSVFIAEPTKIVVTPTISNVRCFGESNGIISLAISGGATPYTITWTDENGNTVLSGVGENEIEGLVAGKYYYEIVDNLGNAYPKDMAEVRENPAVSVTTSLQSVLENKCFGDEKGEIVLDIKGGTGTYSVNWIGVDASKLESDTKAINLGANTYNIDINDSNGCGISHVVTVTEPAEKLSLLNETVVENICHDGVDGSITLEMRGGTPNYTYYWQGEGVSTSTNTNTQSNLKAGEKYSVVVYDANRCKYEYSHEMFNPSELTLSLNAKDITCHGSGNGSIEAIVTGEAAFTYNWTAPAAVTTPYQSIPRINCEVAGMYQVTVTDKYGCTKTDGVEIKEPKQVLGTVKSGNISCNNANDGEIRVYAEGGSGVYTYALYKVGESAPISTNYEYAGLESGAYQYVVSDENNCTWTSNAINIINPDPIDIKYDVSNVTIHGEANGKIDLNISGGTKGLTGYKIEWTWGPSIVFDPTDPNYNADKEVITGLKTGTYTVVVTDENNCAATVDIFVDQPEDITFDIAVEDVRCYGETNGRVVLSNIKGGIGNYTITLTAKTSGNTYTGEIINGLAADKYDLVVVDDAGAEVKREIEVKQPDELKVTTVPELSKLSVDCFGNATGEIRVAISGGNPAYNYHWIGTSGNNIDHVKNLTAGTYGIMLQDAKGCTYQYTETIVGPADELRITETIVENKCYGENKASIDINVTGGTPNYTYLWTGPGINIADVGNQDQKDLFNGQAYKVTVIDGLGCVKEMVYTLGDRYEILASTSSKDVLCFNDRTGELHATVSGGTGTLVCKWESEDGSYSTSSLDVTNLYADKYIFTVQDDLGCVKTLTEEIKEPDLLVADVPSKIVLCGGVDNGEIYVNVTGGSGNYEYKWYKDYDYTTEIGFGAHITNLGAGEYEVFVEDRNGCKANGKTTILSSQPMQIVLINKTNVSVYGGHDGSIQIEATGGTAPLVYTWSGPTINPNVPVTGKSLTGLVAGYYNVTVEDAVGCTITERIEITQPETLSVIADIEDIKCYGEKGKILLRVSGGTPEYTFEWNSTNGYSNVTKDPEVTGLEAGVYDVKIIDAKGAETNRQYVISHKEELIPTLLTSKTVLDCYEENNGNINIHITGGTLPYSIKWTGPNFTKEDVQSIGNLGVGVYKADIKDANGCKAAEFTQEITQPDEIIITETLTHNNCSNDKEGAIDIDVTGGITPYSFTWSGFNVDVNAEDQKELPQGTYYLNFEDANGCEINKEYKINAKNEISARISGPSNICSGEEFDIQIDVNGQSPWTIEYTDGTNIFTETTNVEKNVYTHTLLSDAEFKLISVVDANGCEAVLGGSVQVDVHELPAITIVSAQEDCCLGEPALIDIIFAGKGPWTIHYTDGALDYVDGPFNVGRDYLKITPTQIGTKTYTIKSVSNDNCSVDVNYSVDITAYTYPNLEVNVAPYVCEPNPLKVSLHATGEAPWHVVYYLNDLKFEHEMTEADEVLDIYPNKPDNVFLFESIKSGKRCVSKLDKQIHSQMGLLPKDATSIIGSNMVCRGSIVTFSTREIPYATSYKWSLPYGFNIVSGLGSTTIEVQVSYDAKDGEVKVWGENDCGEGVHSAINVQVDKPIATGGEITIPPYVCDDETIFPLSVSEVANATNYEWIMPTGYNILSGQGTRSIMVKIDKYALSSTVSVIPSNICAEAEPIKADIVIRSLPFVEAGVDFITDCSDKAELRATNTVNAVSTTWKLESGYAEFENPTKSNTKVTGLMYGDNVLSWNVDDGYCVGYDLVTVTNQDPGITEPEFSEVTICEDYMTLRAAKPEFGMGRWTLIAGDGEIENPNSHETKITGLSNKRTNVIRWEVYSPQCSNSKNVEVVSHDLNKLVDAGSDGVSTTGSFRLSARVINDANVTGTWTVEAGTGTIEDPHNPNTVVNGLATGINTIRWTLTGYECEAYDEIKVRMVDEPIASFNIENTEGCEPLTVQFTNTTIGNAEYKWEFGDGSSSDLRSPIHIFEKAGTYTVKLTASANGRVDTYKGEVNVLPSPVAAFSVAERQLYVPNAEAHFYNETPEAVQYLWQFGDGGSSEKENPVYTYLEDGLYDVTYIVSDINLCSDTLVMEDYIKVGKDSYLVFPTAFTPNVEHSNGGHFSEGERRLDVFYPIGRNVDSYKLEIYSSWGNKVFESNDQYIGWDGYYLGKCAAQGTYFYRAEGRFKDGNAFQYSGNLMLIR